VSVVPRGPDRIRVEFRPNDECAVSTTAGNSRASVTYPRRTTEMRCVVPSLAQAPAGDVELEVVLLPGQGRRSTRSRGSTGPSATAAGSAPAGWTACRPSCGFAPDWGFQRWRSVALDVTVVAATALAILWSIVRGRAS